jgi:hypothetical protein
LTTSPEVAGTSVVVVFALGLAVYGVDWLFVGSRFLCDASGCVLVAVSCVLDQSLLREFEAIGLAASAFINGATLVTVSHRTINGNFRARIVVHARTALARRSSTGTSGGRRYLVV